MPTAGGLAFGAATLVVAFVVSGFVNFRLGMPAVTLAGVAAGALALGLADDVMPLRARLKLVLMLALALAAAAGGVRVTEFAPGGGEIVRIGAVLGALGSIAWLLATMNAVNFMDGADGLAMGMGAIAAFALTGCAIVAGQWDAALLGAAATGALAGFLYWNARGRLYAGDAGALLVGALLGGISLLLVKARPGWLFVPPTILSPFLVDVFLTLAWRSKRGYRLFDAHRDHAYQIAMKAGMKAWQVSTVHAVWSLNAAALSVVAAVAGGFVPAAVFASLTAAAAWVHWRVRRAGVQRGLVGA